MEKKRKKSYCCEGCYKPLDKEKDFFISFNWHQQGLKLPFTEYLCENCFDKIYFLEEEENEEEHF